MISPVAPPQSSAEDDPDRLLTLTEAARTLRISRRHLHRLLADREGPPTVCLGRRRMVRASALNAWLIERQEG